MNIDTDLDVGNNLAVRGQISNPDSGEAVVVNDDLQVLGNQLVTGELNVNGNIVNSAGDVTVNDNLVITGTLTVGGSAIAAVNTATQARCSANTSITTTTATGTAITGASVTLTSPGTSAVYLITYDFTGLWAGTYDYVGLLKIDGTAETGAFIANGTNTHYTSTSRTWYKTGLSAASHTFAIYGYLISAGTVTVAQDHTAITVLRVA